jgi:hypothetical protein
MRKEYMILIIGILILVLGYFLLGYISSYIGWYGYKKWRYRVATASIEESKKRRVFIKELHYEVDSFQGTLKDFRPYIEKGFKYGRHTSEETVPLKNTNYLYQLSFNFPPTGEISLHIKKDQLEKFDSSDLVRGYLKSPNLSDTIIVNINAENNKTGIIRIWE